MATKGKTLGALVAFFILGAVVLLASVQAATYGKQAGSGSGSGSGIVDGGVLAPLVGAGTVASPLTITAILLPCRVVSQANVTLSGTQTIDGVAVVAGDRVLAQAQSTAANNGPYIVAAGAWSRGPSFSTASQMVAGAMVSVVSGTTGANTAWQFTTQGAITVGTTALTFAQISPPSFGSDTVVKLPNASATPVTALELVAALTTNTAGAEVSSFTHKLLSGGAQATTMVESAAGLTVPVGSAANPGVNFAGFTGSGMYRQNTNDYRLVDSGTGVLSWGAGGVLDLLNGTGYHWANATGLYQGGANNRNVIIQGDTAFGGDMQMGAAGALATTAVAGFLDVPTGAGAPTGVPTQASTGKSPMYLDTTNGKVCFNYASAWHCATLTP